MAFQVLYPDSDFVFDLSATPATKATLNSAGLAVELDATDTKSSVKNDEIKVANATTFVESIMDNGSVYSANTDTLTSARLSAVGQMLISENLAVNSFMDASGVSFTSADGTARLSSTGLAISSDKLFKVDDGTNFTQMSSSAIAFSLDAAMSPIVSIGSADGLLITSGPLKPSELVDTAGSTAGSSGQFLTSTGSGTEWVTYSPSTPNLATVLAVATAGDANDLPISNLASLEFAPSAVGQTTCLITGAASSIPAATFDVLSVNYAVDATSGRAFSNQYLEIKVAGVSYWMPLFSAPP